MSGFNYAYKVLDMAKQHDSWRSFYLNSIPDEVACFPISIRGLCCVV
jgi:hypothetical protein